MELTNLMDLFPSARMASGFELLARNHQPISIGVTLAAVFKLQQAGLSKFLHLSFSHVLFKFPLKAPYLFPALFFHYWDADGVSAFF